MYEVLQHVDSHDWSSLAVSGHPWSSLVVPSRHWRVFLSVHSCITDIVILKQIKHQGQRTFK